jgi:hypothetical protein
MLKGPSVLSLQLITTLAVFTLSSCSFENTFENKKTVFDKAMNMKPQSAVKSAPEESPSPSPSPTLSPATSPSSPVVVAPPNPIQSITPVNPPPAIAPSPTPAASASPSPAPSAPAVIIPPAPPVAPPAKPIPPAAPISQADLTGNYVSADSDIEISGTNVVIHSQALSALAASPTSQVLCKIERGGTIDSLSTVGGNQAIHFNITSEKFSAVQSGPNDNICAQIGSSFSEAHAFVAPIVIAGKGFLALKLDETSSDGTAVTKAPGILSTLFFDRDSVTNISAALLQVMSGNYVGAYGGFLANLPIPRLTLNFDPTAGQFTLVDNECAFSVAGPLTASGNAGAVILSAQVGAITTSTVTTAAAKTYSVYFGRLSGGCTQRLQNFVSQLTGAGIKLSAAGQTGKFTLDYSGAGGAGAKYTIRPN